MADGKTETEKMEPEKEVKGVDTLIVFTVPVVWTEKTTKLDQTATD